jgi:hypothetical protein
VPADPRFGTGGVKKRDANSKPANRTEKTKAYRRERFASLNPQMPWKKLLHEANMRKCFCGGEP